MGAEISFVMKEATRFEGNHERRTLQGDFIGTSERRTSLTSRIKGFVEVSNAARLP